MSDKAGSKRMGWLAGLAGGALVAALVFSLWEEAPLPPPEPEAPVAAPTPPPAPPTPAPEPVKPPGMTSSVIPPALQAPEPEDEQPKPYPLDLEALRARLPDNLYWELGAPTKDPELIRKREEETRRWNELFGRVQAGDATEAEIQQYYERRRKVSEDMLLFATTVLEEQGDELPDRDRGLYELSINMHRTRLSEYPRQEADALAHRRAQEARRQQWRQQQQQQGEQTPP